MSVGSLIANSLNTITKWFRKDSNCNSKCGGFNKTEGVLYRTLTNLNFFFLKFCLFRTTYTRQRLTFLFIFSVICHRRRILVITNPFPEEGWGFGGVHYSSYKTRPTTEGKREQPFFLCIHPLIPV